MYNSKQNEFPNMLLVIDFQAKMQRLCCDHFKSFSLFFSHSHATFFGELLSK